MKGRFVEGVFRIRYNYQTLKSSESYTYFPGTLSTFFEKDGEQLSEIHGSRENGEAFMIVADSCTKFENSVVMDNLTTCSLDVNIVCWRTMSSAMNYTEAVLMTPVILMMILFMVVGAFGNALVLFVYYNRKHKSTNLYIKLLAVTDLFACAVIHPYIIYKLFNTHSQTWVGLCKTFEYFVHLNLGLSSLILLLIAIDRYFAICRPVRFLVIDRHMLKGIAAVIVISVVCSLPLFEFYGAAPNDIRIDKTIFVEYKCHYQVVYQNSPVLLGFSVFILSGFLIETSVMAVLYKNVAVTAYRKGRMVMPLSNAHILAGITPKGRRTQPAVTSCSFMTTGSISQRELTTMDSPVLTVSRFVKAGSVQELDNVQVSHSPRNGNRASSSLHRHTRFDKSGRHFVSRLKAAKMLFLVTAVFFCSWLPFFIQRILTVLDPYVYGTKTDTMHVMEAIINHFIYLSNAANPLVYTLINQNFRQDSVQVFRRWCTSER